MSNDPQLERLETKIDQINTKLDSYMERLSRAETDISWVKGFVKVGFSAVLSALGALLMYIFTSHK